MPAAARGNGNDSVASKTGTGILCAFPLMTTTGFVDSTVLINGIPAVKEGDPVAPHPFVGCGNDGSVLTAFSSTVFIEGKGAGRLGDQYTSDNTITSGSPNVFFG
jgi:uncharacterized Zn-binding protein involved in type VI secretion